jgi:hypothetical protein
MSKERVLESYDNVNALEYFDYNPVVESIIGPFLGLDARKVSLSGLMKNIYSVSFQDTSPSFLPQDTSLSKYPTQQSLFDPWISYLQERGVRIYTEKEADMIRVDNHQHISSVIFKDQSEVIADSFIFSCSLEPMIELLEKEEYLSHLPITSDLRQLKGNLQLYFTMNVYFAIEVGQQCTELVLIDMPWKPIIQVKRSWKEGILEDCDSRIADVWNVGYLDHVPGLLIKKPVRECSKEEAIKEGLYQIRNSQYLQDVLNELNLTFEEVFVNVEVWYEFYNNQDNKLRSKNPKFSLNTGKQQYMPKTPHPVDLPENMFLAGYYVESTKGGVSMEASCETGLTAAKVLLQSWNQTSPFEPFRYDTPYVHPLTAPIAWLDRECYNHHLPPATRLLALWLLLLVLYHALVTIKA